MFRMRRFSVARETVRAALKELLDKNLVDRRPGYGTFLVERAEIAAARKSFAQWNAALAAGVFVNVGEFGVWKKTPHAVTLALMEDELSLFKDRYTMSVPGHATHLIRLTPVGDAGLKPCLRDIRDNAWRRPFDRERKVRWPRSARPCPDC